MKKMMITLLMAALMPYGMAWAFHDGGGGGGDRGGGGGWSGGGNSGGNGGGGNDNSVDNSKVHSDSAVGGQGRSSSSIRSGRAYNGRIQYYGRSNGVHHFQRFNSSSGSQAYARYGSANWGFRSNAIPQNLRQMGVTRVPNALSDKAMLPNSFRHSVPALPSKGPSGQTFSASIASPKVMSSPQIQSHMAAIVGDKAFMAKVAAGTPTLSNHYYWHSYNGVPYVSYWPGYGGYWYGWGFGGAFYWTQFYAGNWWWYDPWWGNWCWWWGGNWWWEDPATTTVYIYQNGNYTAANNNNDGNVDYSQPSNGQASVQPPNVEDYSDQKVVGDDETAASALAEGANTLVYHSKDGSCTVKLSPEGDAFLYDETGSPNFLDSNVATVKFSKPGEGPMKILLILKDGSFEIFNADGTPANGTKT